MRMKRFFAILTIVTLSKLNAQTWKTEDQYIQQFAPYAVEEMEKYKIPASITLAQGLLETGGGQSRLAIQGNNHFGIKCKETWTGKTMTHTDDAPNECFRVYDDPRQSYEDHSIFLATRKHYGKLFELDPKDYKAWAHGLKRAGYATNPRYAYILISKIEKHKLYEFDNVDSKNIKDALAKMYPGIENDKNFLARFRKEEEKPKQAIAQVATPVYAKPANFEIQKSDKELLRTILIKNHPNGDLKYVVIPADTTIGYIAKKFGINEHKLMKWNDLSDDNLKKNDIIFLESKASNGNIATYKAQANESMHEISQKFAIKLSKLYSKNRMNDGAQAAMGQLIYLQNRKPNS